MSITTSEIKRILSLSKLYANADELSHYEQDLNHILPLLNSIKNTETVGFKPMVSPLQNDAPLRQDIAHEQENEALFDQIAPAYEAHHFIVPKVIE